MWVSNARCENARTAFCWIPKGIGGLDTIGSTRCLLHSSCVYTSVAHCGAVGHAGIEFCLFKLCMAHTSPHHKSNRIESEIRALEMIGQFIHLQWDGSCTEVGLRRKEIDKLGSEGPSH